jgi:hypothetical protein
LTSAARARTALAPLSQSPGSEVDVRTRFQWISPW